MITKTEALALRINPFSKTSNIVNWLTPEHGQISTVSKGANRPKSALLGQYDMFYTCEILYYTKERNGLHILKECSPLETRTAFRNDWRSSACASYICDILLRTSVKGGHHHELYAHAINTLDFLCENGAKPQSLFWFELQLAAILGLAPALSNCAICGTSTDTDLSTISNDKAVFSPERGGIVCPACANSSNPLGRNSINITDDIANLLKSWGSAASPSSIQNIKCNSLQVATFRKLLGFFISYHLDLILTSRKIALDIVTMA